MLLSHEHKFIFIKTHKTAGTSIEVDLSKLMGPRDIITPIRPPVEGHEAQNFLAKGPIGRLLKRRYFNHMRAKRVRELAGRRVFDSYFKFCVEREPVSKCISMYSMLTRSPDFNKNKKDMTWEEYVEAGDFPEDSDIYLDDDGTLLVDRIIKYENLNEELAEVAGQVGIPLERVATKAKTGFRQQIEVTPKQRQVIYDAFAPMLPHTGYTL